jgi:folate-binding protein YgfZ
MLTGYALLPNLGVIKVAGEDAQNFLQGQFTADLRRINPAQGCLAAWCNPQGRVLFLMQILAVDDGFLLVVPISEIERLLKRLRMFVLRATVSLEDWSAVWAVAGIAAEQAPAPVGLCLSEPVGSTRALPPLRAVRLPGATARCWMLGPEAAVQHWLSESGLVAANAGDWWADDAALALPRIEGASSERFLPQQLNLDRLGMMSFDKGCYPGQEIIARLKYRGQVKARLRSGETTATLASGTRLFAPRPASGQSVGEVVSVTTLGEHTVFTAVVDLEVAGELRANAPDGDPVRVSADSGD